MSGADAFPSFREAVADHRDVISDHLRRPVHTRKAVKRTIELAGARRHGQPLRSPPGDGVGRRRGRGPPDDLAGGCGSPAGEDRHNASTGFSGSATDAIADEQAQEQASSPPFPVVRRSAMIERTVSEPNKKRTFVYPPAIAELRTLVAGQEHGRTRTSRRRSPRRRLAKEAAAYE
jgi:hypothetical protein